MARILSTVWIACALCAAATAADHEEKFPDGTLKAKYAVDSDDKKSGPYLEYFESGKLKIKTTYKLDARDGTFTQYHENGKLDISATYKQGVLTGDYKEQAETGALRLTATYKEGKLSGWRNEFQKGRVVSGQYFKDGELIIPRSLDQTKKKLAEIYTVPPEKNPEPVHLQEQAALRRLKAYRYLCDVPYEDIELDPELSRHALAAAQICEKLGKLDHQPPNPGLPEDQYQLAKKGAGSSNLHGGSKELFQSIDAYMNDSGSTNIEHVGHRRWCLNPALQKTGFGMSGTYAAMWSIDKSRKIVPDYDFVSFPARGYMPLNHFKPSYAWSITLNPAKYKAPDAAVKVKVFNLDKTYNKVGQPLELTNFKVDLTGKGVPNCIIFLPKLVSASGLARYWVEAEGIQSIQGQPATVHFVVEFVAIN